MDQVSWKICHILSFYELIFPYVFTINWVNYLCFRVIETKKLQKSCPIAWNSICTCPLIFISHIFHPWFIMSSPISLNEGHIFSVTSWQKLWNFMGVYDDNCQEVSVVWSSSIYQVVVYLCIVLSFWPNPGGY